MNLKELNVGLDVDGVLCNFTAGVIKRAKNMGLEKHFPSDSLDTTYWNMSDKFSEVMRDAWRDPEFWLALPKLARQPSVPFIPRCYITSRVVPSSVTRQWLDNHGFPAAEVITVKQPSEKLAYIQDMKLSLFVDDYYITVQELLNNGVDARLYRAPYQRGHVEECKNLPTIDSLDEVITLFDQLEAMAIV